VLGVCAGLASLPLLYLSRSATSVASVIVAMAALLLGLLLSRADRFGRARVLFVCFVALLFAAAPLVAAGSDAVDFLLAALGRNATLTGRTDLWRYAVHIIASQPVLGYGFQAFWLHDQIDAEALWSRFSIASRTGFHFHSSYVEAAVELGYAGVAVLIATFLGILIGTLRWSWQDRSVPAAFFVAVVCCLVARSITEVDALAQFQPGTFMLFVAGTYAAAKPKDHRP
jgi:exopolysaccharide production protein ExoQ